MKKDEILENALKQEGVDGQLAEVVRSIFQQESGGNWKSKSSNVGATGGMQIMPNTFKQVADKGWDIKNPEHNARAGVRYLKEMNQAADGDMWLTAVGYYGGPGAISAAKKGVARKDPKNPSYPDTFQYADKVLSRTSMGKEGQDVAKGSSGAAISSGSTPANPEDSGAPSSIGSVGSSPVDVMAGLNQMLQQEQEAVTDQIPQAPKENAWQAFLAGLQGSQGAGKNPVTAADLDFANMQKEDAAKRMIEAQLKGRSWEQILGSFGRA